MKIRKAKKPDTNQISEIYKTAYSEKPYNEKWNYKNAKARILDCLKNSNILIIEDKKKNIMGFVIYDTFKWEKGKTGYIDDLVIKKELRGKGLGKTLMKKAEERLKKKKVKEIWLQSNPKSRVFNFYKKKGYKETGWVCLAKTIK